MQRYFLEALLLVACVQAVIAGDDPLQTSASGGSGGENKFLKYLFNKYGSKGVISFEVSTVQVTHPYDKFGT